MFELYNIQAQKISGYLLDSSISKQLDHASVSILNSKDSTFIYSTRTNINGLFVIPKVDSGRYILFISHPQYADFIDYITTSGKDNQALGTIQMFRKELMLQNVVVVGKRKAIVIKGDTVEFAADSFINREGATVEDLLKKLPGMTVDKNGKVTAFGKEVEKVLVDGEEFFGDDPTMATKNLQAQSVDKVQVFDQQSEQAQQTGIDDGQKTKTINIQLKEEAKTGYLGKVSASGGSTDNLNIYDTQGMLNYFKKKRKISVFALSDNYNYGGLSWDDEQKYGGMEYEYSDDGNYSVYKIMDEDDNIGTKGFPVNKSAGLHYSDNLKNGKHKITVNYRYAEMQVNYTENNFAKYIYADSLYNENKSTNHRIDRNKNTFNLKYEYKIDSLSYIRLNIASTLINKKSHKDILSQSFANLIDTVNDSKRNTTSDGQNQSFNIGVLYNKKFKLKGRSMNIKMNQSANQNENDGLLFSENNYYNSASTPYQLINQNKLNKAKSTSYSLQINYTEPLGKKQWYTEATYSINNSIQNNSLLSYNLPTNTLDSVFSNNISYNIINQKGGLYIKANKKKFDIRFGTSYNLTNLNQFNAFTKKTINYPFVNIIPEMSFTWKLNKQKDLTFRYNGRTNQPTINQIQPLKDNSDPFNIIQGNPNLKQEFKQNFSLRYNFYKVLNGTSLWSGLDYSTTANEIIYTNNINEQGIRSSQYTNLDGNYNIRLYGYFGKKLKKLNSYLGYNINGSYYHNNNFVNTLANLSETYSFSNTFSFSFDKEKWPEISLNYRPSYNYNVSSINKDIQTKYWQQFVDFSFYWKLKKDYEIGTDIEVTSRQKLNLSDKNNNFIIWNAYIGKKVFKDKSGTLQISCDDILKQRIGFNRYINLTTINENYYTLITRYWMVKFIWTFADKSTKAKQKKEDEE